MTRVMILGFGPLARKIIATIKTFPEYGEHKEISVGHIFTRVNSLSYGPDLVVEIPDPHGDGYRTYNDGFQALDNYSTTVSNYLPWLLEETAAGNFNVFINCMSENEKSKELVTQIKSAMTNDSTWIRGSHDEVVSKLRDMIDGGKPWTPVTYSEEFLSSAASLWADANEKMYEYHIKNRQRDIDNRKSWGTPTVVQNGYEKFGAMPKFDDEILERFVKQNEPHVDHVRDTRYEYYDDNLDCLVIEHDLLVNFFGWHHTEQVAARVFGTPYLKISSATYRKYNKNKSIKDAEIDADYVIEHVYKGSYEIKAPEAIEYMSLTSEDEACAYGYVPSYNAPVDRIVETGLEVITFKYRRLDAN
jgi:hypothetical protein